MFAHVTKSQCMKLIQSVITLTRALFHTNLRMKGLKFTQF